MTTYTPYVIADLTGMAKLLKTPDATALGKLKAGDLVRLHFSPRNTRPDTLSQKLMVRITEAPGGKQKQFTGQIVSDPRGDLRDIDLYSPVHFEPRHVASIHDPLRAKREDHREQILAVISDFSQTPPLVWRATELLNAAGDLVDRLADVREVLDQADPDDDGDVDWLSDSMHDSLETIDLVHGLLVEHPALKLLAEALVDEHQRQLAARDDERFYREPEPFDLNAWLVEATQTLKAALGEGA